MRYINPRFTYLLTYLLVAAGNLRKLSILKVDQNQVLHLTSNIGK